MPPYNAKSWKQLARRVSRDTEFTEAATEELLVGVERTLGVVPPNPLRELLLETNGLKDEFLNDVIYSCQRIAERNRTFRETPDFRELYMPFDHLLFFGEMGNGDMVAFAIHADGKIHKNDVFLWDHESDARVWYANNLEKYLERRLNEE